MASSTQALPWSQPVIVSLNPLREPAHVLADIDYAHPVFDQAAIAAQQALPAIQGHQGVWFAGAWCGHGFHEDGFQAGRRVAESMAGQTALPAQRQAA